MSSTYFNSVGFSIKYILSIYSFRTKSLQRIRKIKEILTMQQRNKGKLKFNSENKRVKAKL